MEQAFSDEAFYDKNYRVKQLLQKPTDQRTKLEIDEI
jgi:hypothetical protein